MTMNNFTRFDVLRYLWVFIRETIGALLCTCAFIGMAGFTFSLFIAFIKNPVFGVFELSTLLLLVYLFGGIMGGIGLCLTPIVEKKALESLVKVWIYGIAVLFVVMMMASLFSE